MDTTHVDAVAVTTAVAVAVAVVVVVVLRCSVCFVLFWFCFSCVLFWYTCEGSQPTPALVWVCTRWHCVFPTANYLDIFSWDVNVCTYIYIVIYCIWYYHYVVYSLRCCIYVYLNIHMYLQYIYICGKCRISYINAYIHRFIHVKYRGVYCILKSVYIYICIITCMYIYMCAHIYM